MLDSLAQKIIADMAGTYNAIAAPFAVSRQKLWPEFGSLKTLINTEIAEKNTTIHLLDVGCGNGRLADIMPTSKVAYTGLDISSNLIALAKTAYPAGEFVVGSMLDLPFQDHSFDLVVAIASLQHIPSEKLRLQALQEMFRVTKANGLLFMTNWNLWQPSLPNYFIHDQQYDSGDAFVPWKDTTGKILAQRYYHGFRLPELEQLLQQVGWHVKHNDYAEKHYNIVTVTQRPAD